MSEGAAQATTAASPTQSPQPGAHQGGSKPHQAQHFGGGANQQAKPTNLKSIPTGSTQASHLQQGGGKQSHQAQSESEKEQQQAKQEMIEELEEIRLGNHSAKVSKDIARAIKELEKGFHTKAKESSDIRRVLQDFVQSAKENPDLIFKEFGIDPDQYTQARLAKKLEYEMLDPQARRQMELEEENKRYKAEREEREEAERKQKEAYEFEQEGKKIEAEMFKAWQNSGLPPHPYWGQRMAATMAQAHAQQIPLTWEESAAIVIESFAKDSTAILSNLSPQQLENLVGMDVLTKWREHDVSRLTAKSAASGTQSTHQTRHVAKSSLIGQKNKPSLNESQFREWRNSGLSVEEYLAKKSKDN